MEGGGGAGSPAVARLRQTGGRRPCLRACWDPAVGTPSLGLQCARTRAVAAPSYRPRDSSTRFVRGDTGAPAQDLPSHVSDTHVNPQRFL